MAACGRDLTRGGPKKHIVVILEMCDIMAVASHGDTLLFTENYRLYSGLQLKAVVSHTCLQA